MHVGLLPQSISTNGYLPKPILKNIFINKNIEKKIEIIVQVDDIVNFENNKMTGYWVNNKSVENLLNLKLELKYGKGAQNQIEIILNKNLSKDFLGNFEEYIKSYVPNNAQTLSNRKVPFFYKFIIGESDGLPQDWDYSEDSNNTKIKKIEVVLSEDNIRAKENFGSFNASSSKYKESAAGMTSKKLNSSSLANLVAEENDSFLEDKFNSIGDLPTLPVPSFAPPELLISDCISNLHTTTNHDGHTIGFFSIDIEKFFELTNPYHELLNNIAEIKKADIIDDLKNNGNFIKYMTLERVRLGEKNNLRSGKYEKVFNPDSPPVPILNFNSEGITSGPGTLEKIDDVSLNADRTFIHFSFVDKTTSSLPAGEYKYRIKFLSETTSILKTKFQDDLTSLRNSADLISAYHFALTNSNFNSIVGRFTSSAAILFDLNKGLLETQIVNIVSKLSSYTKVDDGQAPLLLTTLQQNVADNIGKLNPLSSKPEYILDFINKINSRITGLHVLTKTQPMNMTDDNASGAILNSEVYDEYSYTFNKKVEVRGQKNALEFFDKTSQKMLRINRGEYDARIKGEKTLFNAGADQSSSTFWDVETSHSYLTPLLYRDSKNDTHRINELSVPDSGELQNIIKRADSFANLPILRITKEIKEGKTLSSDLSSYLDKISILKGINFESGNAISMTTSGQRQTSKSEDKTGAELSLARLGVFNLKNELQGTTVSPFTFGVSPTGQLTDMKGISKSPPVSIGISLLQTPSFSFKSMPQHFRYQVVKDDRITLDPPTNYSKCKNSFSTGLGSLFYFLTYTQIRKIEYLEDYEGEGMKNEKWTQMDIRNASHGTKTLLCRIVDYTNDVIGFSTDTNSSVNNHYFLLTTGGTTTTATETILELNNENLFYTLNDDGTITIELWSPDSSQLDRIAPIRSAATNAHNQAKTYSNIITSGYATASNDLSSVTPTSILHSLGYSDRDFKAEAQALFDTLSSIPNNTTDALTMMSALNSQMENSFTLANAVDYDTTVDATNAEVKGHIDDAQNNKNTLVSKNGDVASMKTTVEGVLSAISDLIDQAQSAYVAANQDAKDAAAAAAAAEAEAGRLEEERLALIEANRANQPDDAAATVNTPSSNAGQPNYDAPSPSDSAAPAAAVDNTTTTTSAETATATGAATSIITTAATDNAGSNYSFVGFM